MDPAEAIRITAASQPALAPADVAALLAGYGITVDALQVALVLGRTAAPSIRLDRIPDPQPQPAALTKANLMRGDTTPDTPQVGGMPKAEAIIELARHLGPGASPGDIVQELALQGMATDTAYVRTAMSRAKKAAEKTKRNRIGFQP
jgi:nucleotide-binding universal stress UspA family protein